MVGMLTLLTVFGYGQCPIDAKRNNGNPGECTAQLTLIFNQDPVNVDIDSIHVRGVRLAIALTLIDKIHVDGKWKLRYCLTGGNYPPIGLFLIWFRGNDPNNPCSPCFECNPLPVRVANFEAQVINRDEIRVTMDLQEGESETIKLQLSYDGKTWFDKYVFIPKTLGLHTLTIKR